MAEEGSWIDDFNRYLGIADSAIEGVQKVLSPPPLANTTVPVLAKQSTADVKTAAAETTDGAKPAGNSGLLIVAGIILVLLLVD